MRKKTIILVVSGLFYLIMLLLAVFARKLHTAALPHVRIGYLEQKTFTVEEGRVYLPALPEELYGKPLYYVSEEEKNGEIRYVAKGLEATVAAEEQGGYYGVLDGISGFTALIVEGFEELEEGREVFVENEEEIKSWD